MARLVPGPAHEILAMALSERPDLLGELAIRLQGRSLPSGVRVADPVVRLAQPLEVRPDLLFELDAGCAAVEIQGEPDADKRRRWPLLVSAVSDRLGTPGDLVVITFSHAVARWATRVAELEGPLGTKLSVQPVVLLLTAERVEALLDDDRPELALFAAWAIQKQHGERAKNVVRRALAVTARLAEPLRAAQERAILAMLSEQMAAWIREVTMDPAKIPEGPAMKLFRAEGEAKGRAEGEAKGRAEGEARGRAEALLTILETRALPVSEAERARIAECTDLALLERWIKRAVTASSVAETLA
jgi:hypothetical protein